MLNKLLNKKGVHLVIFSFLVWSIFLIAFLISTAISKGAAFKSLFILDGTDFLMDFANSIRNSSGSYAYSNPYTVNPPLTTAFFWFLSLFYNNDVLSPEVDKFLITTKPVFYIQYILFLITCISIIFFSIYRKLKDTSKLAGLFVFLFIILSYPFVFTYERGNIILLVFALSIFFLCCYKDKNELIHELSIIALALAVAMKVYPAIFIVMIIKEKDFKNLIKITIYSLLLFFIPFFFFDGFKTIPVYLNNAYYYYKNFSFANSYNIRLLLCNLGFFDRNDYLLMGLNIAFVVLLFIFAFKSKRESTTYLCLSLIILSLPIVDSAYSLMLLFPAFISLYKREDYENIDVLDLTLIVWFIFNLSINGFFYKDSYSVYTEVLVEKISFPLLYVILILFVIIKQTKSVSMVALFEKLKVNKNNQIDNCSSSSIVTAEQEICSQPKQNNKIANFWTKVKNFIISKKFIFGLILIASITIYNFVWIDRTFTMSECWSDYYVGLISEGKVPYVDFYYYLPPLNLFVDNVFCKLSFGLNILYRIYRLIERIIASLLMYHLLCKRMRPSIACIGCFMGAILTSANNYFLGGDYNTANQTLVVFICFSLFKYAECIKEGGYKKYIWAAVSGFIGGLMFLSKQTVFLACGICLFILLILLIIFKVEKNFIKTPLFVLAGAAVPIGIAGVYLFANHAFSAFIYQCFVDTSSKGSIFTIVFDKLFVTFKDSWHWILAVASMLVGKRLLPLNKKIYKYVSYTLFALSIGLSSYFVWMVIDNWNGSLNQPTFMLMFVILSAILIILDNFSFFKKFTLPSLLLILFIVMLFNQSFAFGVYNSTPLFSKVSLLLTLVFCFFIVWAIYHFIAHFKKRDWDLYALVMAFIGIASGYTTIMANGESGVVTFTALVSIPALVFIVYRDNRMLNKVSNGLLKTAIALVFAICLSQKFINPYVWWGDSMSNYWSKTETVDIDYLKGMKFTPQEKKRFEEVNKVISFYTDEESTIWGFPYVKIFNILQNNYNLAGFVPVLFYDVCADDYAIAEAEYLKNNEPDIVVWLDIPNCIEAHEYAFRGGEPLGQREIIKWFAVAKDTDYSLVAQSGKLFVYKMNDDVPVTFTYIEDPNAVNETATILS